MPKPELIGYITLRVPVRLVSESESWEIPETYTYLQPGDTELVSHDIPVSWHKRLRSDLEECGGIEVGDWGPKELAETTLIHEQSTPVEPAPQALDLLIVQKAGQ